MSDLTATNCGCRDNRRSGCGCDSSMIIIIILLLSCCGGDNGLFGGGCGNGLFGGGCGNDCDNDGCGFIIPIILILCLCGGF